MNISLIDLITQCWYNFSRLSLLHKLFKAMLYITRSMEIMKSADRGCTTARHGLRSHRGLRACSEQGARMALAPCTRSRMPSLSHRSTIDRRHLLRLPVLPGLARSSLRVPSEAILRSDHRRRQWTMRTSSLMTGWSVKFRAHQSG